MRIGVLFLGAHLIVSAGLAQLNQTQIEMLSRETRLAGLNELRNFLSIPNNARNPRDMAVNLEWLRLAFEKRGFLTKKLVTPGNDMLLAQKPLQEGAKTVLFYAHFDGQPTEPAKWDQVNPFDPVLKVPNERNDYDPLRWSDVQSDWNPEWRIFARSASDDKSPIIMLLTAIDALEGKGLRQKYNIKVILDSEEETGSKHLPNAVKRYEKELESDFLIIFDGPRHITNQPTLAFGARGIIDIEITVYGPRNPLHSGHYGNYAPNPAFRLASLLASMKDRDGRTVLPGFYGGIELTPEVKRVLDQVPDDDEQIMKTIGIAEIDKVGTNYQESMQFPSLNIRGFSSGWVGNQALTIIPSRAIANLDIRTVPENKPDALVQLLKDHIGQQGYHFVKEEPTEKERQEHSRLIRFDYQVSYHPFRSEMDSDVGLWLNKAMVRAFGRNPIRIWIGGGSLPITPFTKTLEIPAVVVPLVNADNNQHSPNENLRLGNFEEGIRTCLAILTEPL